MKYVPIYAFFLMSFFHTSCGQNQTNVPKDNVKTETKEFIYKGYIFIYNPNLSSRKISK